MYSTKTETSCQLWTLGDNDVSIQVPQCSTNTTLVEEADGAWLCMCGDVGGWYMETLCTFYLVLL